MKCCIRHLSCCLTALIMSITLAINAPAFAQDAKKPGESDKPQAEKAEAKPEAGKKDEAAPAKDEAKEATPAATADKKPETLTVKKELLKIEVSLDGVFEAKTTTELKLKPKAWTTFKVLTTVEHGTRVKQGDLLVTMDMEKIDRAIGDLRDEQKLADLDMKLAEQQMALMEKTNPLDLEADNRLYKNARDDMGYYFDVSRAMSIKSANQSLKSSQQYLENQEEELRQLKKMYEADDLIEETEEIVLKRAAAAVERARLYLEMDKLSHDRLLKVTIPRRDVSNKDSAVRSNLAHAGNQLALTVALKKQRLTLEKLKITRARSDEKLNHLLADRAAMVVKAPVSGVVYHGKLTGGKVSSSSSSSSSGIRAGGSISAGSVFMTIVQTRPMSIRTSVSESAINKVRAGIKGTAVPTGFPEMKLDAIVDHVDAVPRSAGKFGSRITVALDEKADAVMPGMTCKVKLIVYENKQAITVPPKAIETDKTDEQKKYVYVVGKKGKPKKQAVKTGKRTATKVEILEGLSEGDKILSAPPAKK